MIKYPRRQSECRRFSRLCRALVFGGDIMKKEMQKKLSFVAFVMAVFFAGVVLAEFHSSVILVCLAGIVLLAASLFFIFRQDDKEQSASEKTTALLLGDRIAECMRGNEKAEKGVYIAIKKQHESMEAGMRLLEEKLSELVKAQENAVKTVVLYNKENARQLAVSEREELERLGTELKQVMNESFEAFSGSGNERDSVRDTMLPVVDAVKEMTHRLYEELHENGEAMLSELGTTTDSVEEIKGILEELKEKGMKIPTVESPTLSAEKEPEEVPEYFEEVAEAEMVPEAPEETVEVEKVPEELEEVVTEEKMPEDPFASSGVDLSDPNKTLSADDIAALFAAMGN